MTLLFTGPGLYTCWCYSRVTWHMRIQRMIIFFSFSPYLSYLFHLLSYRLYIHNFYVELTLSRLYHSRLRVSYIYPLYFIPLLILYLKVLFITIGLLSYSNSVVYTTPD